MIIFTRKNTPNINDHVAFVSDRLDYIMSFLNLCIFEILSL